MSGAYRYIGVATPREDGARVVTGAARFLDDLRLPGLLHAAVARSPHAHAWIKAVDRRAAQRLPGVEAVLTWEDVPDWFGGMTASTRVLDRKVRFVGDSVALVAAGTREAAEEAVRRIAVEYEVLPAVLTAAAALAPGAPQLYDKHPGNVLTPGVPGWGAQSLKDIRIGDVERGLLEADVVAEGTFGCENIPNPMPPESPAVIGLWEEPNKITVWISDQAFYKHKGHLRRVVGKGYEIRTLGVPCGGSYGSKSMSWQLQLQAVLLSRATGRPVKLVLSKEEHLAAFTLRPSSRMNVKVGMKRDGTVTALAGEWLLDTGYYSQTTQAQVAVGLGEAQLAVRCPNWDLTSKIVCTNRNASGMVRGFGGQELKCSLVPILSLAMERAGVDPLEFFKKNYVKPGDGYFWRDGQWTVYRGVDYTAAMDEGARRFGWAEKWKGWLRPSAVRGALRRGVGVGVHGNADIGEDASEAYLRLDPDGTATIYSSLVEHGTGQKSNISKMAAEVLGLPLGSVFQLPSDSATSPFERGPGGSRGTYATGSAVIAAAEDARRKLLELAGQRLGVAPERLDTEGGAVFDRGDPATRAPWEAVLGAHRTCLGYGRFEQDFTLANCMLTFAEVEVDTRTGAVALVKVVNATDVGQVIDPPGLEGQLNGCLGSGGIDGALFEETVLDRATGHMLNANMVDYKWRTFLDLPPIENVVLETPFPSHRFHAVGVGEVATAPGPGAVLMAASNALGVWLDEYPLTPERILRALGKAGAP